MESLKLKFWGTRGIISSARKSTNIFGGNTTCLQVLHDNHLIIVDTGFGVALLGEELMKLILEKKEKLTIHIFFTHFHWDHIQGLAFFHPIYFPSTKLHLYAPMTRKFIWESLDILFDGSYSPFAGIDSMPCNIEIHELTGPINIDKIEVRFIPVDHHIKGNEKTESLTYAYKFKAGPHSIVFAPDHEGRDSSINGRFVEFSEGVEILVHDAQFMENDAVTTGLGHSTVNQALRNALKARAQLTLLTHHDPKRDDNEILKVTRDLRKSTEFKSVRFEYAREGVIYDPALSGK
ncbi:MAG: MBL fold metallo-hydrolase [Deltaproteobacteria bacterium]|nr:MBL fold metallo-hydrolase [Deltaproteobacteria bacterium]